MPQDVFETYLLSGNRWVSGCESLLISEAHSGVLGLPCSDLQVASKDRIDNSPIYSTESHFNILDVYVFCPVQGYLDGLKRRHRVTYSRTFFLFKRVMWYSQNDEINS
ncbi:hypothetical protein JTE90_021962 [Oedothorax gibbosus]|uniref:Uncharacterized protein n=1 Tax=Oedothorax gibbosus TaxID=931172 RepID=A0AAV6V581_9ARAC|nr:hypothetical protein JTE90_021962 [Oedothorax gibbosus]